MTVKPTDIRTNFFATITKHPLENARKLFARMIKEPSGSHSRGQEVHRTLSEDVLASNWQYRELAPSPLDADPDNAELSRAEWFWRQRPKLILGEGLVRWAHVCLPMTILFSLPISFLWFGDLLPFVGLVLVSAWSVANYFALEKDIARLALWRREVSVGRLLRTRHGVS